MSGYAVRNDGLGWRAVDSAADCTATETYSAVQPAPVAMSPHAMLQNQAQAQLDVVTGHRGAIIRCVAAGVAVPIAWTQYVQALRAIANGADTTSTTLPTQPAYPAGT